MSTATLHVRTDSLLPGPPPRGTWSPPAVGTSGTTRFLTAFSGTPLSLMATVIARELGWSSSAAATWPAAGAVAGGWALAAAVWLHRRGWESRTVLAVLATAAAVLTGPAALGWLGPEGLVLWGPVSTVLIAALALVADPIPGHRASVS